MSTHAEIKTHTLRVRSREGAKGAAFEVDIFLDGKPIHRATQLRVEMLPNGLVEVHMSLIVDVDLDLDLEEAYFDHACVVCHRYVTPKPEDDSP